MLQSFEPGEDWFFDFRTGEFFDRPGARRRPIVIPPISPYLARRARSPRLAAQLHNRPLM